MQHPPKILIVEDEMVIAANISLELTKIGYEVTGIIPRGEEALVHMKENTPDIILMDIILKGNLDGIDTIVKMQQTQDIPVIYLTANADEAHFNRAKETHPFAFISKPFKKLDLQRAVELVVSQKSAIESSSRTSEKKPNSPFVLNNCIFVRHHDTMVKVEINDILYVEAERNYCRIYAKEKEYLLVITLKNLLEKLPAAHFMRVHRSYIVHLSQINEVSTTGIVILKKFIPVSKAYREELLNRLQTI